MKKEAFLAALLALCMIFAAACGGGEATTENPVLTGITAEFSQGTAVVYKSAPLNELKPMLTVKAQYDDESEKTLEAADYTLSGTLTAGVSAVTASYTDGEVTKTAAFNVTVTEAVIESISVADFDQGEFVIFAGQSPELFSQFKPLLVVTATLSDGSAVRLDNADFELDGDISTAGTATITVYLTENSEIYDTFDIEVTAVAPVSITAVYSQSGTVFTSTALNSLKADLIVMLNYNDGGSETLESGDYTLSGVLEEGDSEITVDFLTFSDTFGVEVTAVGPASIAAAYTPSGTVYTATALNSLKNNLVVTLTNNDGSSETLTSGDYTLSGTLTAGTSAITVTYEVTFTAAFNVSVTQSITLAAPAVTFERGANLTVTVTGDSNGSLFVLFNNVAQSASGSVFTANIMVDTVIKAQSVGDGEAYLTGAETEKFAGSDYLSDVSSSLYGDYAFLIESFTSAGSLTNVSKLARDPYTPSDGRPIVDAGLTQVSYSNAYTSSSGMLKVTDTGTRWTNWSGYTYNFPQALSAAGIEYVVIDFLNTGWGQDNIDFFGILGGNGTAYPAMQYVSYIKHDNLSVKIFVTEETIEKLNSLRTYLFIDIAAFSAANPGVDIAGIYQGFSPNGGTNPRPGDSFYVNSIYFIKTALEKPAISLSRSGSNLNVSITGDGRGDLEVYFNGVKQVVMSNTFTAVITTDTVIKAQSVSANAGSVSSVVVTKYVGANYLSDTSGTYGTNAYLIESFTSADSLTNVSKLARDPYTSSDGRPIIDAGLVHNPSYSNARILAASGMLQVTSTTTLWTNWSGYTYNFPQVLSTSGIEYVVIDYLNNGWGGNVDFFGILGSDGKSYVATPYLSYIITDTADALLELQRAKTAAGGDTITINSLRTFIFFDIAAFAIANPGVDIAGIYQGSGRNSSNLYYINSIYYIAA